MKNFRISQSKINEERAFKMFKRIVSAMIIFCVLLTFPLVNAGAKKPFPKVKYAGAGKVKITDGKRKLVVNLRDEIAGCPSMTTLHVLDKTKKDGKIYMVLFTEAASRCNPQAMCGAAENSLTLVWLKLNTLLKVEEKKAVIIDDCARQIMLNGYDDIAADVTSIVKMDKGVLSVEYEQNGSEESRWRIVYNKSTPEKGLVITPLNQGTENAKK